MTRTSTRSRSTKETRIELRLDLDGNGATEVSTGLPFFDHMLDQLGRHGRLGLSVQAQGDLAVDAHHTVEDTGIVLGEAFREALGDKAGVRRFASITVPLDEAAVEVVLDLSGRPFLHYEVDFPGEKILGGPALRPPAGRGVLAGLRHRGSRHTAHRAAPGPQHPPHRGSVLQGRGPGHPRRGAGGGLLAALHQGHAVTAKRLSVILLDPIALTPRKRSEP